MVRLAIPRFTDAACKVADDVVTEVLDPSNRKVAHTHTPVSVGAEFGTVITFTPSAPGSYHLSARFEPAIGAAQRDFEAAVDRSAAPARTLALGSQCSALEVMDGGLVLCLTSSDVLRVYRDEVLLQSVEADGFATAGAAVWTTRLGKVTRHVDLGGAVPLGAELTSTAMLALGGTLLALENEAVLVTYSAVAKFAVVPDAGLRVESSFSNTFGAPFAVVAQAGLDELLVVTPAMVCTVSVKSGVRQCAARQGGELWGADATGVWSHVSGKLKNTHFAPGGGLETVSLSLDAAGQAPDSVRHFESTPAVALPGLNLLPRLDAAGVLLEAYQLPSGYVLMPSSTKTVRAQHADGHQKLFAR